MLQWLGGYLALDLLSNVRPDVPYAGPALMLAGVF